VQPYQPAGYWDNVWTFLERDTPASNWQSEAGPEQYRRGLYTYWKRSFPHPSLLAFDAPTREECVAERRRSNTPLQALVLLNDPTYVEAARALAQRIIVEGGDSDDDRIDWAHRRVLSRAAEPEVKETLQEIYDDHLVAYRADPDAASALLAVGNEPTAPGADEPSVAAWTSVARVLLNLHETTLRN
jgi:hypothetical protein